MLYFHVLCVVIWVGTCAAKKFLVETMGTTNTTNIEFSPNRKGEDYRIVSRKIAHQDFYKMASIGQPTWKPYPGSLKQVSVGPYGVWGISKQNHIYKKTSTGWQNVPGGLSDISVGHNSAWGVNLHGHVFRRVGAATSWEKIHIEGGLKQVSVSKVSDSVVWGTNKHDEIFVWQGGHRWVQIQGSLRTVSCGEAGVWGMNVNGWIYYRKGTRGGKPTFGSDWVWVDGGLVSISSGSLHEVWGIDIYGNIWTSQGVNNANPAATHRWNRVQGMMSKVDIWQGQAWGVDKYQRVFHSVKGFLYKARASSVWADQNENYGQLYAIDGKISKNLHFFHSKTENYPWLELSMPEDYYAGVEIVTRSSCCSDRFRNIEVRAGIRAVEWGFRGKKITSNTMVGSYKGPATKNAQKVIIKFSRRVRASHLTIQRMENRVTLEIEEVTLMKDAGTEAITIMKKNMIETLTVLGKEFSISFTMNLKSLGEKTCQSILHFTTGRDWQDVGSRIPGVWLCNHHLFVQMGDLRYSKFSITPNKSYAFLIKQFMTDNEYWFSISVDTNPTGPDHTYRALFWMKNPAPGMFKNVAVYAGDPWHPAAHGVIKDIKYTTTM